MALKPYDGEYDPIDPEQGPSHIDAGRPPSSRVRPFSGEFDPLPKKPGVLGTLKEGAKSTGRAVASAADAYSPGDGQSVVDRARAQREAPKAEKLDAFYADYQAGKSDDAGLVDAAKNVGGAIYRNPAGAGLAVVEQAPNMVPPLAGRWALAKAGAAGGAAIGSVVPGIGTAAGGAIGGLIGGTAGLFLGNISLETGQKAMELAGDGDFTTEEAGQARREGAIKGAVISGVDVITLGAGRLIADGLGKPVTTAMESATRRTLVNQGVDVADDAAVAAALRNPQIVTAVRESQQAAIKSVDNVRRRVGEGVGVLGMESVGEGLGEYLGELAATGEADINDAVLESFLSLGQSGVETAWGMRSSRHARQIQPMPTEDNPNPAPVDRPDPAAGALSRAAAQLPSPEPVLGLPAPDPVMYADSDGTVQDTGPVVNVDGVMQPTPQARPAEIAGDRTMVGMEGQAPAGIQPNAIPAEEQRRIDRLAQPQIEQERADLIAAAHVNDVNSKIAEAMAERQAVGEPEPNYPAPKGLDLADKEGHGRWQVDMYRESVQALTNQLTKGGDVAYVRDANDRIVSRTPSVNPSWWQDMDASVKPGSVEQAKRIVSKALVGGNLGPKQARFIAGMMNMVDDLRTDPQQAEQNRATLAALELAASGEAVRNQQDFEQGAERGRDVSEQDDAELHAYLTGQAEPFRLSDLTPADYDAVYAEVITLDDTAEQTAEASAIGDTETDSQGVVYGNNQGAGQAGSEVPAQQGLSGRGREAGQDGSAVPAGDAGFLESYTEQDLAERARQQQEAEDVAAQAGRRDQADADRDGFALTGSDRAADVGAAAGQGDLLGTTPGDRQQEQQQSQPAGMAAAAGQDPLFRLNSNLQGVTKQDLDGIVSLMARPGIDIVSVQSAKDLPAAVRRAIAGFESRAEGFLLDGTAYLIADNLATPQRAVAVMIHEVVGHHGVRVLFGDQAAKAYASIYRAIPADVKLLLRERYKDQLRSLDHAGRVDLIADEFMAALSEHQISLPAMRRVVAIVRSALRRIFGREFVGKMTTGDILYILERAGKLKGLSGPIVSAPNSPRFSFLGRNSVNANQDALAVAREMHKNGKSLEEIRKATGWHRAPDRKWRYEISDRGMRFKQPVQIMGQSGTPLTAESVNYMRADDGRYVIEITPDQAESDSSFLGNSNIIVTLDEASLRQFMPEAADAIIRGDGDPSTFYGEASTRLDTPVAIRSQHATTLGEVLDHPALFDAYPQLANVSVVVDRTLGAGGYMKNIGGSAYEIGIGSQEQAKTLIHEVQHIIQEIEGFAPGGNRQWYVNSVYPEMKQALQATIDRRSDAIERRNTWAAMVANNLTDAGKRALLANSDFAEIADSWGVVGSSGVINDRKLGIALRDLPDAFPDQSSLPEIGGAELNSVIGMLYDNARTAQSLSDDMDRQGRKVRFLDTSDAGNEGYMHLYGEMEARNAEARLRLNDEQRRDASLDGTMDRGVQDAVVVLPGPDPHTKSKVLFSLRDEAPAPDQAQQFEGLRLSLKDAGANVRDTLAVDQLISSDRIPALAISDLEGMTIFPTIADRTAAAAIYTGIDSSQLQVAIPLLGGPNFPLRESNAESGVVWANRGSAVTGQKAARLKAGASHMMIVMGDANMHQSNTTVSNAFFETLSAYVRDKRITKKNAEQLTRMVRQSRTADPQVNAHMMRFPGLADQAKLDAYLHRISFSSRRRLLDLLGTKGAQALGAPSMTKILDATREPSLAGQRWGDGVLLVEVDQVSPMVNLGEQGTQPHPDFPLGIRGKVTGRLEAPVNYEILWQDWLDSARENAISRGTPENKVNVRRAFELAKPAVTVTPDLIARIGSIKQSNVDGPRQARLAADFAAGNWKTGDQPVNRGGVSPQEFADAIQNSDAYATLTPYTAKELKAGIKAGTMRLFQLGQDGQIFFMLETRPDGRVELASVVNNEQGARGIGAPAVLLKAIEEGATDLTAFAVANDKYPAGFLPTLYESFGFDVTNSMEFDARYFRDDLPKRERDRVLQDAVKYWTDSTPGFNPDSGMPSVVEMAWRGTDADRANITERYFRGGLEGLLAGRAEADVRTFAAVARASDQQATQEAGSATDAGRATGTQGTGNRPPVPSRAQRAVAGIAELNDTELRNLGLTTADRDAARAATRSSDARFSLRGSEQAGDRGGRVASRSLAPLPDAPSVPGFSGPDSRLVDIAEQYARANGIDLRRQSEYVDVDPARAARIADAYEAMPHAPQDPAVQEAYENLIQQTRAQYDALVAAGYQFWFVDPSSPEGAAYLASPWNAMRDIRENQSMGSYPTDDGFGSGDFSPEANPLLADTGIQWPVGSPDGQAMKPVLANDLFRVVHDAFGHGLEGSGFRARGEENAWQAHVRLFTGSAVGAITSETRGQNSWLNYGPHGERNQTAQVEDTVFADQKTGLMPEWTWTEGRAGDMPAGQNARFSLSDPDLYIGHNISPEGLRHAMELGGLAAPSLGISRTTTGGFGGYGGITLLAPKDIIESRGARTFNADVYSPRQPRPVYNVDRRKYDDLIQRISPTGLGLPDAETLSRDGADALARSEAVLLDFLQQEGIAPKPRKLKVASEIRKAAKLPTARHSYLLRDDPKFVRMAQSYYEGVVEQLEAVSSRTAGIQRERYFEDGEVVFNYIDRLAREVERYVSTDGIDVGRLRAEIGKKLRTKRVSEKFDQHVRSLAQDLITGREIQTSRTRKVPYTLDNVVAQMVKKLRGGEGYNYGAGNIRAMNAVELRSVRDVQARREEIVSAEDFARVKEESQDRLMETLEQLKPFYKYDQESWGYMDDASQAIGEGRKGWNEVFRLTAESEKILSDYTRYIKTLPTEYFEVKMQRAVDFNEFSAAVVPNGTPRDVVDSLRSMGLQIKRYNPDNEGARTEAISKVKGIRFSLAPRVDSPAFYDWFGDSKVVDAEGKPLVVYHGSTQVGHTEFDMSNVGTFFSDRFDIAASYAGRYNEVEFEDGEAVAEDDQGVYETYLSLQSPKVMDWGGRDWGDGPEGLKLDDHASRARNEGYDGLIIENVVDTGWVAPGLVEDGGLGTVYVAFRPEQIKSAIGNDGNFDPANPDIRYSMDSRGGDQVAPVSADAAFDPELIAEMRVPARKSREKLIDMPIADFLALAREGREADKVAGVNRLIESGTRFNSLPYLNVSRGGRIAGHEGRHRARALAEQGYTTMPVILRMADLRWSEQADPDRFDFVADWPTALHAEAGAPTKDLQIPFPVTREQAMQPYRSAPEGTRFSLAPPTESAAFKRWFGDSEVVDADGKPLVVYHGTARSFDAFASDAQGDNFGDYEGAFPRDGFWFTESPDNAAWYAHVSANGLEGERSGGGQQIMPAYLAIQNPYRYTAEMFYEEGESGIPSQIELERQGYDGLIVELTTDEDPATPEADAMWREYAPIHGSPIDWPADLRAEYERLLDVPPTVQHVHYVAFRPEQIKSATGNVGAYGQRPVTADEAARFGMTQDEANNAQSRGDIRFSLAPPTESAAFKRWFGESQVVDENGEPLIVQHRGAATYRGDALSVLYPGGEPGVEAFPLSGTKTARRASELGLRSGPAIWFTDVGEVPSTGRPANEAGVTYPAYLSFKNPLRITTQEQRRELIERYTPYPETRSVPSDTGRSKSVPFRTDFPYRFDGNQRQQLVRDGYDSIILEIPGAQREYIAFESTQIKSATGNVGTFDPANPDIRFSLSGQTQTSAFKRWFGDSKVVDAQGKPLVVYHGAANFDGNVFRPVATTSRLGNVEGFYFGGADRANQFASAEGGEVIPVYLSITNPFVPRESKVGRAMATAYRDALREANPSMSEQRFNYWADGKVEELLESRRVDVAALNNRGDLYQRTLRAGGYDGMRDGDDWVSFRPEQIKSAIGNVGAFDPINPDIRYSRTSRAADAVLNRVLRTKATTTADAFNDLSPIQKSLLRKVGTPPAAVQASDWLKARMERAGTRIRQGIVDRYASLKELDEKLHGKDFIESAIHSSSWVLARMSSAASGAMQAMMSTGRLAFDAQEKVITLRDGKDTGGLTGLLAQLGSPAEVERWFGWVAANRAEKLMAEGRENLFTADEIRAGKTLNTGRTEAGNSRPMLYGKVFREFQQYRDDVLGIAEKTGIISADNRAMWRDEFYVPFYRVMEEEVNGGPSTGKGLSRQEAFKKLKGGNQNLNDLLENTLMNFHHLLSASLKNQAATQVMENAQAAGIARRVPESRRDTKTSTFILKGGRKVFYQVDDGLVFEALTALADPGLNNLAVRTLSAFKRVFTNMTTVTPQFIIANTMRDLMQAAATSPTSKNVIANLVQGTRGYRDATTRAEMQASGGAFSFGHLYGADVNEVKASLQRTVKGAQLVTDPAMVPKLLAAAWRKWGDMADTAENLSRTAIYQQNVQQRGRLRAAYEARDVMDFSQHGAFPAVRFLIRVVPFLNARLQGLDKLYRSGAKPALLTAMGKGTASDKQAAMRFGVVTGALTLASIALYLANVDDDEFRKLEDWQKDAYWPIRIGDSFIFIPKPFEVGAIATMAERVTEQMVDDKATGKLFAARMKDMMLQTFSFSPVPQAFQPVLDVYSNKDAFTGRQIESVGMERLSKGLRSRDSTTAAGHAVSAVSRVLGDDTPVALSPVQADHLIRGYLGAVGANAAGIIDTVWRSANGEETPDKRWSERQPFRRFYRDLDLPASHNRYSTLFYEGLREAGRVYADVKELQELGRTADARELQQDKRNILALRSTLNQQQRRVSAINKRMEAVRRSDRDGAWKRRELDRLTLMRSQIMERVGKRVESVRASS